MNLPDLNGYEVFRILHEDPTTSHIPIMALSSNAFIHDIQKGFNIGFFRYLTKPFEINVLMDAIDTGISMSHIQ
ncbi:response regulator [Solimicrobium silvestre]|uniref:Response regulator receiver domain n=1 Tax=Solimicrobium silvestre TaxID=2099400 RepID=A0A2S9GUJ7_9BURK|nr:response regulator [Solimicrobium silvestre]PRC91407.1 Response regulator receiver domain [Solimicrobium silvestre]